MVEEKIQKHDLTRSTCINGGLLAHSFVKNAGARQICQLHLVHQSHIGITACSRGELWAAHHRQPHQADGLGHLLLVAERHRAGPDGGGGPGNGGNSSPVGRGSKCFASVFYLFQFVL